MLVLESCAGQAVSWGGVWVDEVVPVETLLIPLQSDAPDSACLNLKIILINLGSGRARKNYGDPCVWGDMSASPPLDGGPQDLVGPLISTPVGSLP